MAAIQKGTFGVVWSLGTSVAATGLGTNQPQSLDFSDESDNKPITAGPDGEVKLAIWSNNQQNATIEVIPSGATIAAAKAANICPSPGADVTITDADDAEVAGVWHCMSASKRKTVEGEVRITMSLKKYPTSLPLIAAS